MLRKRFLIAGAVLFLSAIPAFAQRGGGGHSGGSHGGGRPGSVSVGVRPGGVIVGVQAAPNLHLSFGIPSYGYGYGGGYYRPSYYSPGYYSPGVTSYYGNVPYLVTPGVAYPDPSTTPTQPTPQTTIPPGSEVGLRITDLYDGNAKSAGLRKGDIIVKVDGVRTQNFEELRATLAAGKTKVTIEYIDGSNGETEKKTVNVSDTKIGVSVAEVVIPKT